MVAAAGMRILVTEDEPRILSFLARGLEAEGFSVDSAADGAEALRRVGGAHYDLVVLDLLLPHVNGLTVLSELRRAQPEVVQAHAVPDARPGHEVPHPLDDAGHLVAERQRQRLDARAAAAVVRVGVADPGGLHAYEDVARAERGDGDVVQLDGLAGADEADGAHAGWRVGS